MKDKLLQKYIDIEQKIGVDLDILFKAFNGIRYKKGNETKIALHIAVVDWAIYVLEESITIGEGVALRLNDYGKTWVLIDDSNESFMTEKELLVFKKIERIARGWYNNFKIERENNNIIFIMEQESQDRLNEKREYRFISENGREFRYHGYLTYYNDLVVIDENPQYHSGIILHIFAQICDVLDGLLNNYHVNK